MTIHLTPQEAEGLFYNALCNGLSILPGYGLELRYSDNKYKEARKALQDKQPKDRICFEDVLMEVLRLGGTLQLADLEGDGEWTRTIALEDVHSRVHLTPLGPLMDEIEEQGDASTAEAILQTVFFLEIVFG